MLVGESSRRVVELHRRHAEVGQDHVGGWQTLGGQDARQPGEIARVGHERLGAEAGSAKRRLGARQLEGIDVEADEAPAGLQALQHRPGMTTAAERAVDRGLAGLRPQALQHLGHHDRAMAAGRRLAGLDDLLDVVRISLGASSLYFSWNWRGCFPS